MFFVQRMNCQIFLSTVFECWMYQQDERTEYWEMHSKWVSDLCSAKVLEEK